MANYPNNLNVEMAVLGALISNARGNLNDVIDMKVTVEDFHDSRNRQIFEAIMEIGESCDYVILSAHIEKIGAVGNVGGWDHLEACFESNLKFKLSDYCDILREMKQRRSVIMSAESAIQDCQSNVEPQEVAARLSEESFRIFDVAPTIDKNTIIDESLQLFDNAFAGIVSGVPLPWDSFSTMTGGLQKRCVCPLMGRDGVGKSFMVSKILHHLGLLGIPALSIPFEDGADRQMRRIAGCHGGYSTNEIERALYKSEDGRWKKMDSVLFQKRRDLAEQCLREVSKMPIFFEDTIMTVEQIRAVAGKHKRKHDIQILFVDGVKDVAPSKGENATKQEEHISRILVQTAKELDIAIVPICHLTDVQDDVRLSRRNMRGAKSQFHNARQVLIYQNAGVESPKHIVGPDTIALHMEKNNYGKEAMCFLEKDFDKCNFKETKRHEW